jgi:hypothetical protein
VRALAGQQHSPSTVNTTASAAITGCDPAARRQHAVQPSGSAIATQNMRFCGDAVLAGPGSA